MSTTTETPTVTIERPRLQPVSFDLYRDIHKAIRAELFAVVAHAGRLDPADDVGRRDLADQVIGLVSFLQQHARHEDGVLQAPLEQAAPGLAAQVADEHEAIEARMAHLVALADILRQPAAGSARAAVHELYVDLAAFTADYLSHQDREERVVAPVLEQAVGFDGLLRLHGAILAGMPPQELFAGLALMFPAMNVDDRTELLGGIQATAPASAFEHVWGLARSVLTAADAAAVAARLGLD